MLVLDDLAELDSQHESDNAFNTIMVWCNTLDIMMQVIPDGIEEIAEFEDLTSD